MAQQTVNPYGITKGAAEIYANTQQQEFEFVGNNRGDLLVAPSLPPYAELVRLGNTWTMCTAAASAFDLVAAMPTTLATAILFNNEAAGGKSYVIHSMFCQTIVSTAAAGQLSLVAQVLPNNGNAATAPTHSATTTILTSNSGKASYTGAAKRAVNVTTAIADLWQVVGAAGGHAAANKGAAVFAPIDGRIIIPPQGALLMNVVAGTVATAGGLIGCTWSEVQLTLG